MRIVLPALASVGGCASGLAEHIASAAGSSAPSATVSPACIPPERPVPAGAEEGEPARSAEEERARFAAAVEAVKAELAASAEEDSPLGAVFAAHLEMLEDPLLEEQVEASLAEGLSATAAVDAAAEAICAMFADIDDEYLRARTDDVRDVCRRICERLTVNALPATEHACGTGDMDGCTQAGPMSAGAVAERALVADEGVIVVAEELFPSDLARMDFSRVRAFITARGSVTSHVCIIARSKGIPALLGVDVAAIPAGVRLLVDAPARRLVIDPSPEDLAAMSRHPAGEAAMLRRVPVFANAGSVEDVRAAMQAGADGIGVFRTELLFMQAAAMPTEDEQFAAYREAAQLCSGKPLIIRTLDIGGDKALPYLPLPREDNPYLGFRALRLCLDRPEALFKPQLRAILRASLHGDVRILLPMVTSVGEVRAVRRLLAECMQELDGRQADEADTCPKACAHPRSGPAGHPYGPAIPVGVMIETPAAVLIADQLAREADFFSIGTNDLTQYILAADRGNPAVAQYYDSLHPAVLRAISMTVAAAHGTAETPAAPCSAETPAPAADGETKAGRRIPVGVCGEMAADPVVAERLVSLGVDDLSLTAPEGIADLKRRMGTDHR